MIEIERRFICRVSDDRYLEGLSVGRILQGYLTDTGPAVRIRREGDAYLMTIKVGRGLVRREVEFPVPPGPGEELLSIAGSRLIEKRRYRVDRWEIDLFDGRFEGLMIAEVELDSESEPLPPLPPGLELGEEVTYDDRFSNQALAALDDSEAMKFIEELQSRSSKGDRLGVPPGQVE